VGNTVGIGRGLGANRSEGACHSLARKEKDSKRVIRGNCPFYGPLGSGEWVTGHKRDMVRRTEGNIR
jgi:hypothetical protein